MFRERRNHTPFYKILEASPIVCSAASALILLHARGGAGRVAQGVCCKEAAEIRHSKISCLSYLTIILIIT